MTSSDPPQPPVSPHGAQSAAPASTRVIKRYSNRKLYDTVESRYVTLPQIAELVRRGEDVRIIDNNSKDDLTSVTLAQILYEEERKQSRALPLTALKGLIHTSSEKIMTSLRESPVGKFIPNKGAEGVEGATPASASPPASAAAAEMVPPPRESPGSSPPASSKDAPQARIYEMLEQGRGSIQEWQHRVDERVRKVLENLSPISQWDKLQAEVRRLSQRVEELESRAGIARKPDDHKPE